MEEGFLGHLFVLLVLQLAALEQIHLTLNQGNIADPLIHQNDWKRRPKIKRFSDILPSISKFLMF